MSRNLLQIVEGAIEAHENPRTAGVDRAGRRHRVLSGDRGKHILRREAEIDQPGIAKLDEHAFRPLAHDVDLLHAGDVKQALAQRFRNARELALGQAVSLQCIDREVHVGIFIVDERALHAGR